MNRLMRLAGSRTRLAVLVAAGAWAVHQLRYALAFEDQTPEHIAAHSHTYLNLVGPVLVWTIAAALASWIVSLGREEADSRSTRFAYGWLRAAAALTLIYAVQEGVEGALAPGHPEVISGIFGDGGWIALPLSVAIGALIALTLVGARVARAIVSRARTGTTAPPGRPADQPRPPVSELPPRANLLATRLAGRAPPRIA